MLTQVLNDQSFYASKGQERQQPIHKIVKQTSGFEKKTKNKRYLKIYRIPFYRTLFIIFQKCYCCIQQKVETAGNQ